MDRVNDESKLLVVHDLDSYIVVEKKLQFHVCSLKDRVEYQLVIMLLIL